MLRRPRPSPPADRTKAASIGLLERGLALTEFAALLALGVSAAKPVRNRSSSASGVSSYATEHNRSINRVP
jgi:hypothetical protein